MKIGIVGYQGSGKSTLFHWLTGESPDPILVHKTQSAMAVVPEPRVHDLCQIYHPKKVTMATLEMVDTPGLSRSHEGSATRLAMIREAGCLVIVVAAFDGNDPAADLLSFEEDLLIADLDIVSGRIERLQDSIKKPRPNREDHQSELQALLPMQHALEQGQSLRHMEMTPEQRRVTRSFQLFSEKPRLYIINTSDAEDQPDRFVSLAPPGTHLFAFSLALEMELAPMDPAERDAFCQEMQVQTFDRDRLVRTIMDTSGQMLFFTAGEKEVRTWMIRQGGTAVEAAGNIHTDLAQGFIRAETMQVADLVRLGSEREIKAHNLMRQEPKDYVIRDGDILFIRHN
jgi:ribosome-binding ATPase YchF (GTP1/OBG family)